MELLMNALLLLIINYWVIGVVVLKVNYGHKEINSMNNKEILIEILTWYKHLK